MGLFDSIGKGISNLFSGVSDFVTGSPAQYEQVSNLTPGQMKNQLLLQKAARRRGIKGGFGQSSDFYRDILENDPQSLQALFAPEMRQFNEDIIPQLAEQFAGMGAGGMSSSGFQNSATRAATDLSERLAQMRQGLRFQAAQGLSGLGLQSLQPYSQYTQTQPGHEGFLSNIAPSAGTIAGTALSGPIGSFFGNKSGNMFSNGNRPMGSTNPYGGQ